MENSRKENKFANLSLEESELRYRRLFESAQDGILILEADTGAIIDVNPFLIKLLGYTRDEFISKKLWEMGAFKDIKASKNAFLALQQNEYIRYKDLPLKTKSGKLIQVEFVSNVYMAGKDKVIQCNVRDITERRVAQMALIKSKMLFREQSVRDHLTGLYNRRYMEEALNRELYRALRKSLSLSVIMLDVDGFKLFNDTYGHATGDVILHELGKLLINQTRAEDIACRYGGDEFIIVLPEASREVAAKRAEGISEKVKLMRVKFEGRTLESLTLSLGVAVFPEDGATSATLLKAVDEALFRAKREGRNRIALSRKKPDLSNSY